VSFTVDVEGYALNFESFGYCEHMKNLKTPLLVCCRFGGNNTVYHEHRRMTELRTETESRR